MNLLAVAASAIGFAGAVALLVFRVVRYAHPYYCTVCDDPIEFGQVRIRVRYLGIDGDAHDDCAEAEARQRRHVARSGTVGDVGSEWNDSSRAVEVRGHLRER